MLTENLVVEFVMLLTSASTFASVLMNIMFDIVTWYCRDRASFCNMYAVQQDTRSVLMSEFIEHLS